MSDNGLPEREMGAVGVIRRPNGMVAILAGETAMEGTWIDGLEFAQDVLMESLASAKELGVEREIIIQTMLNMAK